MPKDLLDVDGDDEISTAQAAAWANLHAGLESSLQWNKLDSLEVYKRWGPIVARFSFTL